MDRSDLLNRVRHLLNKTVANGATEAEAAVALKAAERLMAEHNIATADLFAAGECEVEFNQEVFCKFGARLPGYYRDVANVVEEVFGVHVLVKALRYGDTRKLAAYHVLIFGEASKLESAGWGFNFLCETFRNLWTAYRVRHAAPSSDAQSYYSGLRDGFLAKIQGDRADERSTALVKLDEALEDAFQAAFPGLERRIVKFRGNADAYGSGVGDGRSINLARPVERGNPRALAAGS